VSEYSPIIRIRVTGISSSVIISSGIAVNGSDGGTDISKEICKQIDDRLFLLQ
jgi:hypothetical protein